MQPIINGQYQAVGILISQALETLVQPVQIQLLELTAILQVMLQLQPATHAAPAGQTLWQCLLVAVAPGALLLAVIKALVLVKTILIQQQYRERLLIHGQ